MTRRQVIIVTLYALAEASVIEPLILLLPTPLRSLDTALSLVVLWLVLCAIAFNRRIMAQRDTALNTQRLVVGGWLVGLLIVTAALVYQFQGMSPRSLSVLLVEFAGVVIIWWRGVTLGVTHIGPDSARLRLQVGLLVFVGFGVATFFTKQTTLLIFMLPFLAAAVFAMPLSHIERVEKSPIGRPVVMDRKWWQSLLIGAGVPILLCILAALLISGDLLTEGIRLIIVILLLPVLAVAFVVGYLLSLLITLLFKKSQANPLQALQGLGDFMKELTKRPEPNGPAPFVIPPEVRYLIGLVVVAIIIVALIWLTGRARREEELVRTDHDNLQDLGPADEPEPIGPVSSVFRSLNLRRWLAAITIRRIYVRMDHEAGKRGYSREAAETPFGHLPLLGQAFPLMDADVRIITEAYVRAHYGEVPDTDEALGVILNAWERVRATPRPPPPPKPEDAKTAVSVAKG